MGKVSRALGRVIVSIQMAGLVQKWNELHFRTKVLIIILLAGIPEPWLINKHIVTYTSPYIHAAPEQFAEAQTAIVLGARVYSSGNVSAITCDRLLSGVELYKAGKVSKILISGDHGKKEYDEVNTMKHWILRHDVPEEDIFMDHAGFSTYDSMYRAKAVFNVKSAIVVTQDFHIARAVYLARKNGIQASGYPADKRPYLHMMYNQSREFLARVKDFFKVNVFYPEPKYLGEMIDITGNGIRTQD